MALRGIDVSSAQGQIDWSQVAAAGIQFAAIKATEGVTYTNPFFAAAWTGAKAAGLQRLVYHYGLPGWNAPQDEAAHFLAVVGPLLAVGDVLALDLEENQEGRSLPGDCGPWALRWFEVAEAPFSCLGMLYTNLDLIQNHGLAVVGTTNRGLWLASPGKPDPPPPAPWPVLAIVQTSWSGQIPGIGGQVDLDTFRGDAAALAKYGVPDLGVPPPSDPRDQQIADLQAAVADLSLKLGDAAAERDKAYARITAGLATVPAVTAALQGGDS